MSLSKEISAITECSICADTFVDPRVLPCVHTFCLKCLESYGDSRKLEKKLVCPLCRASFELPSKKFKDLPVNFFIQKLIEVGKIAEVSNQSNACDACSAEKNTATVYCFDCRQSLCEHCCQVHNKLRYNRSHLVVEFGKKQVDELLKVSPTFCDSHPDEMVKFFCSDCETTICMSCYVEEHSSHKCLNIAKVSEGFLQQIKTDFSKVSEHVTTCLSEEEKLKKKRMEFLEEIKRQESIVNEMVKELCEVVHEQGRRVMLELEIIKQVKLKEFDVTQNEIEDRLAMMESFKRYSQEVMTKATPADITRLATMLKKRAVELHAMRLDNDTCVFDVEITSSNQMTVSRNEDCISDITVYHSRKENKKAYLSPCNVIFHQIIDTCNQINCITTVRQELFLLRKESKNVTVAGIRNLVATASLIVVIPTSFQLLNQYNQFAGQGQRASYTQCDTLLCDLQLYHTKSSNQEILELVVARLNLIDSDGNATANPAAFNLEACNITPVSNINNVNSFVYRSPDKFFKSNMFGIHMTINISGTTNNLKVNGSITQMYCMNNSYPDKNTFTFHTSNRSVITSSAFFLEVYNTESRLTKERTNSDIGTMKPVGSGVITVQLPNTFTDGSGIACNRTTITQCESVLVHLQLMYNESSKVPGEFELQFSNLRLSDTAGVFTPSFTFETQPYHVVDVEQTRTVRLKSTEKLISSGYHGLEFSVQISGMKNSVTVQASVANVIGIEGDYPCEMKIEIPTSTCTASLKLKRSINLPPSLDPTDLVSCNFYNCVYIGDRHGPNIHRCDPWGTMTKWSITDQPNGLSVTSSHTLVVTFSEISKMREYTTHGTPLRELCLDGITNPSRSAEKAVNEFIITTGTVPLHLATFDAERVTESASSATPPSLKATLKEITSPTTVAGDEVVSVQTEPSGGETTTTSNALLNGPVQAIVDRFGFIFVMTTNDARIHLFDPHLNYICELIRLSEYEMQKPSKMHFQEETGRMYVSSFEGSKQLLAFQITDGKVDPSVWRKRCDSDKLRGPEKKMEKIEKEKEGKKRKIKLQN